jgi:hypothetical protein
MGFHPSANLIFLVSKRNPHKTLIHLGNALLISDFKEIFCHPQRLRVQILLTGRLRFHVSFQSQHPRTNQHSAYEAFAHARYLGYPE